MKRLHSLARLVILAFGLVLVGSVGEADIAPRLRSSDALDEHLLTLYSSIDFGRNITSFKVFKRGVTGYLALKAAGNFPDNNMLSLIDFTLSSNQKRFWIIDVASKKLLFQLINCF